MSREPAYFDSQASAAVALKIDIREIRAAKKAGCSAFRSGRVYKKALLKWIARNKSKRTKRSVDPYNELKHELCGAMISLAKRFDTELITADEYFELCAKLIGLRHLFA